MSATNVTVSFWPVESCRVATLNSSILKSWKPFVSFTVILTVSPFLTAMVFGANVKFWAVIVNSFTALVLVDTEDVVVAVLTVLVEVELVVVPVVVSVVVPTLIGGMVEVGVSVFFEPPTTKMPTMIRIMMTTIVQTMVLFIPLEIGLSHI